LLGLVLNKHRVLEKSANFEMIKKAIDKPKKWKEATVNLLTKYLEDLDPLLRFSSKFYGYIPENDTASSENLSAFTVGLNYKIK